MLKQMYDCVPGLQKTMNHAFIILTMIQSAENSYLESRLVSAVLLKAKSRVLCYCNSWNKSNV